MFSLRLKGRAPSLNCFCRNLVTCFSTTASQIYGTWLVQLTFTPVTGLIAFWNDAKAWACGFLLLLQLRLAVLSQSTHCLREFQYEDTVILFFICVACSNLFSRSKSIAYHSSDNKYVLALICSLVQHAAQIPPTLCCTCLSWPVELPSYIWCQHFQSCLMKNVSSFHNCFIVTFFTMTLCSGTVGLQVLQRSLWPHTVVDSTTARF